MTGDLAEWRCPSCGAVTRALMADRQDAAAEAARAGCADELRAHATAENQGWLPALADRWDGKADPAVEA